MAVKLRPETGDEADILGTTNPAFVTRTPEEFLELLRLRRPDPETGQPDMEKLGAFLAAHPESQPAIQATIGSEPPASFAQLAYRSPHSFKLVDAAGEGTWVRYRWRPEAGEALIPDDEARERGRDYLREELAERLRGGPAGFELLFQIAAEGDPIDDPTAIWPEDRELVGAGRLEITEIVDDPESGDHIEVFDPIRIVDGIELSDDPDPACPPQGLLGVGLPAAGDRGGEPIEPSDGHRVAAAQAAAHRGIITRPRAVSSVGRAPRLHRGGRWFEPGTAHQRRSSQGEVDVGRAGAGPVQGDRGRRGVPAPELEAAEGRAGGRDDPGQAGLDGRLPGRRPVRACGTRAGSRG